MSFRINPGELSGPEWDPTSAARRTAAARSAVPHTDGEAYESSVRSPVTWLAEGRQIPHEGVAFDVVRYLGEQLARDPEIAGSVQGTPSAERVVALLD
ncbi:MAG: hypothetical protein U0821_17860 [Chloroflexota bacterium]